MGKPGLSAGRPVSKLRISGCGRPSQADLTCLGLGAARTDLNCSLPVSPYLQMITNECNGFYQKKFGCYAIGGRGGFLDHKNKIFCLKQGRVRWNRICQETFFFLQEKPFGSRSLFLSFFFFQQEDIGENTRQKPGETQAGEGADFKRGRGAGSGNININVKSWATRVQTEGKEYLQWFPSYLKRYRNQHLCRLAAKQGKRTTFSQNTFAKRLILSTVKQTELIKTKKQTSNFCPRKLQCSGEKMHTHSLGHDCVR